MTQVVDELAALLPAPVERRETHGAWVLLTGEHAYKLRKPVRLPYLDYSDIAHRLACARAEVALNQSLAPGIYLGVRALIRDQGALALGPWEPTGAAEDYVVVMRRFDEAATMAARVTAGTLAATEVDAVGGTIAAFHARARPLAVTAARARIGARIDADLRELAQLGVPAVGDLRRFASAALARHAREIDQRAHDGRWRDGHGDLRAEHVVLTGPPAIVDRVEFDADLRRIDVASDLAFLAMDLEALDARWAAARMLNAYAAAGGCPASAGLQSLLAWQRAIVRWKIAVLRDDEAGAARLQALAATLAWRERVSPGLLVCGPPASGKSTLAGAIAAAADVTVVSTDRVRKALHGAEPTQELPTSAYSEEVSRNVYREAGRRAAEAIDADGAVVVDATAHSAAERAAMHAGLDGRGPLRAVVCGADRDTLRARAASRLRDPTRVSDAGPQVAVALADAFDRPRPGHDGILCVVELDTTSPGLLELAGRVLDDDAQASGDDADG